ncbi:MAG: transcription termination/antitermination NusG family protein [Planctomycetales bacterium]
MPILTAETDLFPDELLEEEYQLLRPESHWWVLYTRSRREKELMRRLESLEVPFYGPMVEKRFRTPAGRAMRSQLPLFANYVFMFADPEQRYSALTTNCVSRDIPVVHGVELLNDLRQLRRLIATGMPLQHENTLGVGTPVRVCTGPLAGQEGIVLQCRGNRRLLVGVRFLQQGASVQIDECELERLAD